MSKQTVATDPGLVTWPEARAQELAALAGEDSETQAAVQKELFGLAISGGGIRSATFALGALQMLAQRRLLGRLHYLSTVSGGGYIGSWLMAWWSRYLQVHPGAVEAFEKRLAAGGDERQGEKWAPSLDPEPWEVRWLRAYGKYLAPNLAAFSPDSWMIAVIWLRNTLLNLLPLLAAILTVMMAPWVVGLAYVAKPGWACAGAWCGAGAVGLLLWGLIWALRRKGAGPEDGRAVFRIALLLTGSCGLAVFAAKYATAEWTSYAMGMGGLGAVLGAAMIFWFLPDGTWVAVKGWGKVVLALRYALGAALGWFTLWGGVLGTGAATVWMENSGAVLLAPILLPWGLVLAFSLSMGLMIGLGGRHMSEGAREWWSRLGAVLGLIGTLALAVGLCALAGPALVFYLKAQLMVAVATGSLWAAVSAAGVWLAQSAETSGGASSKGGWKEKVLALVPAVFIAGFGVLVATGAFRLLQMVAGGGPGAGEPGVELVPPVGAEFFPAYFAAAAGWKALGPAAVCLPVLAGLALLLSRLFDLNTFSMHGFYLNRLVRAYQGASRGLGQDRRQADPDTNFDMKDEISMAQLRRDAEHPMPIYLVNTAVNRTGLAAPRQREKGVRPAGLDERRASSFVFTPYGCGYESGSRTGYALRRYERPEEVPLGLPVTASGAAASPNMGYHTSATLAFLMTVLNVRLGCWITSPRRKEWVAKGPKLGILYSFLELFGRANDDRKYVYLSDGGHFENLAVYELLRRRVKYIICLDGEEDGHYQYEGLSGLVRKARVDFRTEIIINTSRLRPRGDDQLSEAHCAVGRIFYPKGEDGSPAFEGTLLYVKASLTGDEPRDVLSYRQTHEAFPHESTGDQFFSESQFESYRRLGLHVMGNVLLPDGRNETLGIVEGMEEAEVERRKQARVEIVAQFQPKYVAAAPVVDVGGLFAAWQTIWGPGKRG